MSKRLEAMRANPAADWRIRDVEMVCAEFGLRCSPPRGGGSHCKIGHALLPDMLSVPFARPIKSVYIRKSGWWTRSRGPDVASLLSRSGPPAA